VERTPVRIEVSELNSLPNRAHGVKVKVQIMQRVKDRTAHFTGQKEVAQIGA
jgi:hypothetical protein